MASIEQTALIAHDVLGAAEAFPAKPDLPFQTMHTLASASADVLAMVARSGKQETPEAKIAQQYHKTLKSLVELHNVLLAENVVIRTYSDHSAQQPPAATATPSTLAGAQTFICEVGMLQAPPLVVPSDYRSRDPPNQDLVLVDSGCARSVCPRWFATDVRESLKRYIFRAADGRQLMHRGTTEVVFYTAKRPINLRFEVTDVPQAMLSVAACVDSGKNVVFTPTGSYMLSQDGEKIPFIRRGNAFFLMGTRQEPVGSVPVEELEDIDDGGATGADLGPDDLGDQCSTRSALRLDPSVSRRT